MLAIMAKAIRLKTLHFYLSSLLVCALAGAASAAEPSAETCLQLGDRHVERHEYDLAIVQYTLAIQRKSDWAEAYNNRGHAYYWKWEGAKAIADFDRAILLRSNYPTAFNNRGCAYMASGEPDKAIRDFNRAIALRPDYPRAYGNRANAYLRKGRIGLALADFERIGRKPVRLIVGLGTGALLLVFVPAILAYRHYRRRIMRRPSP
jgi:tetratricopeptide (TPR) repeat protein